MPKIFIFFLLLSSCNIVLSQGVNKKDSAVNGFYSQRFAISEPPYGLQKIKSLISGAYKAQSYNGALDKKRIYRALSLREKFTYNMIKPEQFSQICSSLPINADDDKKIFAELPNISMEYKWSSPQLKFFLENRDSVIYLAQQCILTDRRIGLNFKQFLIEVNAKALIPLIIATYKTGGKDHDLLTLLMLLMQENKDPYFTSSELYKKLYGGDNFSYQSYIDFNAENDQLIISYATNFYNGLPK